MRGVEAKQEKQKMAGNRDTNKRLKAIGLPIELCVKYERLCGIKPGQRMSFTDRFRVSEAMISALEAGVRNVPLSAEDYTLIAEEVRRNENSRPRQGILLELMPAFADEAKERGEIERAEEAKRNRGLYGRPKQ
jgi:hypothetical protein